MPAWPMPTQKTKLVMSKPQPTVRLRPQVPMPVVRSCSRSGPRPAPGAAPATRNATHQPRPGRALEGGGDRARHLAVGEVAADERLALPAGQRPAGRARRRPGRGAHAWPPWASGVRRDAPVAHPGEVGDARARTPSSASTWKARGLGAAAPRLASGSPPSPKVIARAGQLCWQAVCTSGTAARPSAARRDPRGLDPLHAEGALLHDARARARPRRGSAPCARAARRRLVVEPVEARAPCRGSCWRSSGCRRSGCRPAG